MPAFHENGVQAPLHALSSLPAPLTSPCGPLCTFPSSTVAAGAASSPHIYQHLRRPAGEQQGERPDRSDALPTVDYTTNPALDEPSFVIVSTDDLDRNMPVDVQRPHRTATLRAMLSVLVLSTLTFVGLANHFRAKDAENPSLSSLSSAWIDRQSCAWFHKCGVSEPMVQMKSPRPSADKTWMDSPNPLHAFWTSGTENASTWDNQERKLRKIPDYVMKHAPYVHLYSGEGYWPCDMAEHLLHTTPHVAFTPVEDALKDRDLDNLDELNKFGPVTFLQSDDNIEDDPDWLGGESNIPSGHETSRIEGKSPSVKRGRQSQLTGSRIAGGRSDAPAVLLVVDKGDGIVDAFWFFFYSYNLGNAFLGIRFGNHVGDWEHTAVRFRNGQPTQVFFSEHAWGQAFSWDAVEKIGDRVSHVHYIEAV